MGREEEQFLFYLSERNGKLGFYLLCYWLNLTITFSIGEHSFFFTYLTKAFYLDKYVFILEHSFYYTRIVFYSTHASGRYETILSTCVSEGRKTLVLSRRVISPTYASGHLALAAGDQGCLKETVNRKLLLSPANFWWHSFDSCRIGSLTLLEKKIIVKIMRGHETVIASEDLHRRALVFYQWY